MSADHTFIHSQTVFECNSIIVKEWRISADLQTTGKTSNPSKTSKTSISSEAKSI